MSLRLTVVENEAHHPAVEVPAEQLWSLMEFLSLHRVAVSYEYRGSRFQVTFQRMTVQAAQQLLEDWGHAEKTQAMEREATIRTRPLRLQRTRSQGFAGAPNR